MKLYSKHNITVRKLYAENKKLISVVSSFSSCQIRKSFFIVFTYRVLFWRLTIIISIFFSTCIYIFFVASILLDLMDHGDYMCQISKNEIGILEIWDKNQKYTKLMNHPWKRIDTLYRVLQQTVRLRLSTILGTHEMSELNPWDLKWMGKRLKFQCFFLWTWYEISFTTMKLSIQAFMVMFLK